MVSEIILKKYYKKFIELFNKELIKLTLLKYQSQDYKIKFKLELKPVLGLIYKLLIDNLRTLRTNLNKDLV